jgi:hypothetical protein
MKGIIDHLPSFDSGYVVPAREKTFAAAGHRGETLGDD